MAEQHQECPRCKGRVRVPRRVYKTRMGWVPLANCERCGRRFSYIGDSTFACDSKLHAPTVVAEIDAPPPVDYRVSSFM